MAEKKMKISERLIIIHEGCRRVIFDALGIEEMNNSGFYISGWYFGGFSVAISIGMLRREPGLYSLFVFFLSIILIILLTVSGLSYGRLKNKFRNKGRESEN